ncbi:MAG: hypothetical protein ACREYE_27060, partial [Gammaproteobacteria bacterium]
DIIKKIERARVKMEQIKPRSTLPRGKKEGGLTVKLFKGHYTSDNGGVRDIFFIPAAPDHTSRHVPTNTMSIETATVRERSGCATHWR